MGEAPLYMYIQGGRVDTKVTLSKVREPRSVAPGVSWRIFKRETAGIQISSLCRYFVLNCMLY